MILNIMLMTLRLGEWQTICENVQPLLSKQIKIYTFECLSSQPQQTCKFETTKISCPTEYTIFTITSKPVPSTCLYCLYFTSIPWLTDGQWLVKVVKTKVRNVCNFYLIFWDWFNKKYTWICQWLVLRHLLNTSFWSL